MKSQKAEMQMKDAELAEQESSARERETSRSGIRPAVNVPAVRTPAIHRPMQIPGEEPSGVTVIFRGMLPMEKLVTLIRQRAGERRSEAALRVEIERGPVPHRWHVRLHSERGELAVAEDGPFLAVTRAFAMLHQSLH